MAEDDDDMNGDWFLAGKLSRSQPNYIEYEVLTHHLPRLPARYKQLPFETGCL